MIFEPEFGLIAGRAHLVDQRPESSTVVVMLHMREFMQNDVILHKMRRHDETPVQHDPARRAATAPARGRVPQRECLRRKTASSGEFL